MATEDQDWRAGEEPTRQMPASEQPGRGGGRGEPPSGMSRGRMWAIGLVAAVIIGLLVALVVLAADNGGNDNVATTEPATLDTTATSTGSTTSTSNTTTTDTTSTTTDTTTTDTSTTDTTTTDTDSGSGGVSP